MNERNGFLGSFMQFMAVRASHRSSGGKAVTNTSSMVAAA
jgi:hypothetical protein